jgi:hypothetical protein
VSHLSSKINCDRISGGLLSFRVLQVQQVKLAIQSPYPITKIFAAQKFLQSRCLVRDVSTYYALPPFIRHVMVSLIYLKSTDVSEEHTASSSGFEYHEPHTRAELVLLSAYSTLKMETACSFETPVYSNALHPAMCPSKQGSSVRRVTQAEWAEAMFTVRWALME